MMAEVKTKTDNFHHTSPNCATLPEQILESEMFCHAGGVFE